ncbi:hypothetical protein TNCV_21631 [Trichonephila clavipes]|nr:hypothetical protein TNCV_21631 [Trichonephila clavipes]
MAPHLARDFSSVSGRRISRQKSTTVLYRLIFRPGMQCQYLVFPTECSQRDVPVSLHSVGKTGYCEAETSLVDTTRTGVSTSRFISQRSSPPRPPRGIKSPVLGKIDSFATNTFLQPHKQYSSSLSEPCPEETPCLGLYEKEQSPGKSVILFQERGIPDITILMVASYPLQMVQDAHRNRAIYANMMNDRPQTCVLVFELPSMDCRTCSSTMTVRVTVISKYRTYSYLLNRVETYDAVVFFYSTAAFTSYSIREMHIL